MRDLACLLNILEGKIGVLIKNKQMIEEERNEREALLIEQNKEILSFQAKSLELEKKLREKEEELAFVHLMLEEAILSLDNKSKNHDISFLNEQSKIFSQEV
jgi:hypothetical protein